MAYGIMVKIWGDFACFSRPEMKVERVSYDVITPSAARGVIEAIYWKPSIKWIIDAIHVMKPIRFTNIRRNELESVISVNTIKDAQKTDDISKLNYFIENDRQQRGALVLRDVMYVIEAHFEAIESDGANHGKHLDSFNRRLQKGQCYKRPFLGTREFSAHFAPLADDETFYPFDETRDLGWMLHDLDFSDGKEIRPKFYRARMKNGTIDVPHPDSEEVRG